jgi:bifunctional DNase/RNase
MSKSLPVNPSLEHLKNEAKALLKAHEDGAAAVCSILKLLQRFSKASDREILGAEVSLQEVQFALALEYGFASWPDLKKHVTAMSAKAPEPEPAMVDATVAKVLGSRDQPIAVMVLKSTKDGGLLPIYIGTETAHYIAYELQGIRTPRPMTHDIFSNTVEALGGKVHEARVTGLKDSAYLASLVLNKNGEAIELDARPSDAVAIAVRLKAPIRVSEEVWRKAAVADESQLDSSYKPIVVGKQPPISAVVNVGTPSSDEKESQSGGVKGAFTRMEDLAELSDKELQTLFKGIDQADFVVGTLELSRETRNRFLANMSKRAQDLVVEDWNAMGPVDPGRALEVRTKILGIANSLRQK